MTSSAPTLSIIVARDFSDTPGPRSRSEGKFSGDQFKEEILKPHFEKAIEQKSVLFIDLDGTEGYATSFLEAAFGGLAREFSPEIVRTHLKFKSIEEPYLEEEITRYIDEAK